MRKLELWPIRVCYYIAGVQFFVVSTSLVMLFSPIFIGVPVRALFTLLFELRRARMAILSMHPADRAFQPVLDSLKASPNPGNPQG